jgi:DNA-directed RNA polymerase subunit K/omega
MDEDDYSEDENILAKDLEKLKKMIPRDTYVMNNEKDEKVVNVDEDTEEEENKDEDDDEDDDEDEEEEEDEEKQHNTEILRTAFSEFNDDEDEEEDQDEFYLQKFDENTQKKIISDFHPELQSHNYDEIDVLSRVVRDENGNIIDPLHKTLPFITRYEKARILGERAKQINSGAKPFVDLEPNVIDGYVIALKEFEAKKIPFIVKRPLPNGGVEYWKFEDLEVLV